MQKADMLTEITSRLEAAGLQAKEPYGAHVRSADLMVYGIVPIDPQVGQQHNGQEVTIGYKDNLWCLTHRENIPGPGEETVEHYVSTVEEIINVALNFYFGEAQTIEGWLVPTHRYPEWDVARLHQAIEQARSPSRREWYVIDHSYLDRYTQLVQEFCLPSSPRTKRNT